MSALCVTAGVRPFPLAKQQFYSFPKQFTVRGVFNSFLRCVCPLCHWWCPPFSAGHVAFLFICLPGAGVRPFPLAMQHFYSFFSQVLVSALFRWPCSISIHLSARSVTAGVRPFPLAKQQFYSFPKQFTARGSQFFLKMCPPFCVTAGVRPFPLAMQHFYSFEICLPGLSLVVSALFLCFCLHSFFVSGLVSLLGGHCVRLVSLLFLLCAFLSLFLSPLLLVIVSAFSPFCFTLSPVLSPFLLAFLFPFSLVIVSALLVSLCLRSCLPF